jgi:hypothetical protein
MAPAPHWILRVLAGFIVGVIPAAQILRVLVQPDFAKIEKMELSVEANLARGYDAAVETPVEVVEVTVDQRQLNKQRMVAAEKARELAKQAPEITIVQLMRATGCGRGAARKAIDQAKAITEQEMEMAV